MRRIFWITAVLALMLGCSCSESATDDRDNDKEEQTDPDNTNDSEEEEDLDDPDPDEEDDDPISVGTTYVSSAAELKALGTVAAGSVIIWRDGTYADVVAEIKGAGTAGNPVVLRAETPGGVVFTGTSRLTISGSSVEVSGMWWQDPEPVSGKSVVTINKGTEGCVLKDCAITGYGTEESVAIDTKWVSVYGSENSVVGCTLHDKRNIGTLLVVWLEANPAKPYKHTISGNSFTRPTSLYGSDDKALNGQETIRIGTSDYSMQAAECVVEGNYFYHCHGEQGENISNKSCGNVYRGNVFTENQGTLTMRHGNNCVASGNYIFGNKLEGTGGIRLIGENHTVENNYLEGLVGSGYRTAICLVRGEKDAALNGYWQVKNSVVRNNTIVDCKTAFSVNYGSRTTQTLPVVTTRIEDNTVSTSDKNYYIVDYVASPAPDVTWIGNAFYNGKFKNITAFQTTASDPVVKATKDAAKAAAKLISDAAGCSWKIK